ncbi:hypothetical protein D5E87_21795 [Vibrio parahaemolyticus]|uniref:Uncharacterized protein n=3 Tax=Vibrio harveyi group TaxID=717610 RepID=A0A7Y4F092_VIBAL|nr:MULTISPECIES: hypothetical protein [Vibrio harveyi group]HAS6253026.1 hypothetical protein [Vibrio vulnificus]AHJ02685.1 hypothetical protein VPUCM_p0008 [Vibrio parahaemolyticus UCM-V493]ANZ13256.1 hypothetical protein VpaChn25_PA30 [Vibrio parahaemolyticus]APX10174.1 hypothetical protein BWP24_28700 [Vibrio campbellii]EGQ8101423.1 hypothetical protein [Vibrio parahaemolyticus]
MEIETQNESRYKARAAYFSKYRKDRRAEKQSTLEFYEENIERYEASNQSDKKKKRASLATFDSSRYPIGFNPVIMNRKTGGVSRMPTEFAFILKACEELIDNKRRFPSLYQRGGEAMNKRNVRVQMAKLLAVLLTHADLYHGRIGVPTKDGIDTISYDTIIHDYILRWGEIISPKAVRNCTKRLALAGYLYTKNIYVKIPNDDSSELKADLNKVTLDEEKVYEVRSAASYKQFTTTFISELKVTLFQNIMKMVHKTRERKLSEGFMFHWMTYKQIGERLLLAIAGDTLNSGSQQLYSSSQLPISPEPYNEYPI